MAAGAFVSRSFESMLKECSGKKYTVLQNAIQTFLDSIKEVTEISKTGVPVQSSSVNDPENQENVATDSQPEVSEIDVVQADPEPANVGRNVMTVLGCAGRTLDGSEAELVLNPIRLAIETKNVKILESSLDCLHKLIEYDHLEGDPGLEGGKNSPLFTEVLNMVCNTIDNFSPDSTVLQVLKVLLTAVASSNFRVHGESLLGVLRVCYNIALHSKSPVNQATSKAMLTHMISIIFRRMETDHRGSYSAATLATNVVEEKSVSRSEELSNEITEGTSTTDDSVNQSSIASVEELQNLAVGADIKGLEAVLDKAVHTEDGKKITRGIELGSMSIGQRDALLVFRTLCKMGMKEDNDEVTVKTRILSLELLQGLLEGVSHSFTKNFHFIDSVKAYLSYALLRASMSQSSVIFQYASGIFSVLLLRFRESLKGEIGIFFPLVILRSLDGSDCPSHQKNNVLRMLEKVCKDPQMLVDVYVNYDCDLEAPNLFERLVTALSKIAQGIQVLDLTPSAATQVTSVKGSALQCLVSLLKSLVQWEKSRRDSAQVKDITEPSEFKDTAKVSSDVLSRDDFSNDFEKAKAHKSTMEAAIAEFNRKPTKGVDYLLSNKLVERNPESVAKFLKNTQNLDKAMIGDYLGQHEAFPLVVMHAFVDSMQFQGMKFDIAIRELLKRFRLPGEAQKIDRIMEKFAEKYCADNPGLFKNADTAYVLAYAVIMLNTDAHNPMVWPKMSKSDFIRINDMNESEDCAPTDLLEAIYDSIVQDEIKMKDDVVTTGKNARLKPDSEERGGLVGILNLALPTRKLIDANSGNEAIIRQTQEMFKKQGAKRGIFYSAQQVEIVRPMVDAVGWPLLATFSVTMEEGENKPRVALCMEGFTAGILVTHVLGMDIMRYAFLASLVRCTFLHAPRDLRSKNAEALRTLLNLGNSKPHSLQDTWNSVLECVSRLDLITSTPSISATVMHGSNQISKDAVLQTLRELSGKPAEHVFVNSSKLPSDTVVEFFTALCSVSAEELKQFPARVFSLQKLVEISYYNMARIRMVWARIWSVLSSHFIFAGSHQDEKIAMYAIDSLRQLGMKYLERAELANFTFQNDILKPFVVLMRNSCSKNIRRLIVDCIVQMIKSKVGSIKSGWRSVFMVFTAAADDGEEIVECAFENVEQVVWEHFDQVVGDCFMDCVNCLIRFANNKSSYRISLKAIVLLRICHDRLAERLIPGDLLKPIDDDESFDVTEHYWFPMLAGLSELTSDLRPDVRSSAIEVLFDLLNERGKKFSSSFWESIFHRVLFPIFDNVRHAGKESLIPSDDECFRGSSIHSLQLLCNLFNTFYKEVCFMLPPLLSLLLDCAKKTDQTVVSIAMGALVHLIDVGGHQFTESDWDTLLISIRDAAYSTKPIELLNSSVESPRIPNTTEAVINGSNGKDNVSSSEFPDHVAELALPKSLDVSEGLPSPSRNSPKPVEADSMQRSQTFGQKLMDNLLLRSFTSKPKGSASDASLLSSPSKVTGPVEVEDKPEEEIPLKSSVRGKCITQLLLLGAIDSIQKKFWENLNDVQRTSILEILLSILEFAASYNSFSNLRSRMQHMVAERPPYNLLRQELAGTTIYLNVLQRATSSFNENGDEHSNIKMIAEEKLVSFCQSVLKDASDLQTTMDSTSNLDLHFVLNLRSPVIVKVLKDMCIMDSKIFRRHLREFYPLFTKLVCCDQMDLRGALGELFKLQLKALVP